MSGNYDRIARFYDADMARNMPFDDVGFYAALCAGARGRVLELGCGNGRILLPLLARGIDATGVDASAGMLAELARKAAAQGLVAPVCRMDVRALALAPGFGVVLCPYSLVTYLTGDDDVPRLLAEVRRILDPGGLFVVDAFVPKPVVAGTAFTADYRRAFGDGVLARFKRVTPLSATHNRIERRYEVRGPGDELLDTVTVDEVIRPVTEEGLRAALAAGGFAVTATAWDYGRAADGAAAQFVALVARPA